MSTCVDALIRLLRVCLDDLTLLRDNSCSLMYHYVLCPTLFLSKPKFADTFVLILCNCIIYTKKVRPYACFSAYQDASRQARSFEFLARDGTGPLKYDIDQNHHRYLRTIPPVHRLKFDVQAYHVALKTFHRSTRTHPCALSAQSFLTNLSRDCRIPLHSNSGPRWLRGYNLHALLNATGVAANPG